MSFYCYKPIYNINMCMKILRTLLATLLFLPIATMAQSQLAVKLTDESLVRFVLTDKPVISFDGEQLLIKSETAEASYARADVAEFYFEPVGTAIEHTTADNLRFSYLDNETVCVEGSQTALQLYDHSGRLLQAPVSTVATKQTISLNGLPAGVYLIKISPQQTIKIFKK